VLQKQVIQEMFYKNKTSYYFMNKKAEINHPYIENTVKLEVGQKYAAIIGANPSQGARSPLLWNAAFNHYQMDVKMHPFDVLPENLFKLLDYLNENSDFLGGSIAVPYKEKVSGWLGSNQSTEVAKIGAVNCIARIANSKMWGYNTDGEASILSFENNFGSVLGKSILILGCGGSAKAVSTYFKKYIGPNGKITIASRSKEGKVFADKINAQWIEWNNIYSVLSQTNIVVNCTTVGYGIQSDQSPLSYEELSFLPRNCIVFDIIYQANTNKLLITSNDQKLLTLDGSDMNIEQAVIAFCNVNKEVNINLRTTKIAMLKILNSKI
jgi:shikimate dehydrogenase